MKSVCVNPKWTSYHGVVMAGVHSSTRRAPEVRDLKIAVRVKEHVRGLCVLMRDHFAVNLQKAQANVFECPDAPQGVERLFGVHLHPDVALRHFEDHVENTTLHLRQARHLHVAMLDCEDNVGHATFPAMRQNLALVIVSLHKDLNPFRRVHARIKCGREVECL
jgi:hypothetical protein